MLNRISFVCNLLYLDEDLEQDCCGKALVGITTFLIVLFFPISLWFCVKIVQEYDVDNVSENIWPILIERYGPRRTRLIGKFEMSWENEGGKDWKSREYIDGKEKIS